MPYERDDGTVQFSLKLPPSLREDVDELRDERRWSRSKTIVYLMEIGLQADCDGVELVDESNIGSQPVISAGTKDSVTVEAVEKVAEERYGGSFNSGARYVIRCGLESMSDN